MQESNYKVYIHEFPNGKVYVGITSKSVCERWGKDGSCYHHQTCLWNAIQKYGWDNIIHDIYAIDLTKEQAEAMEIELIDYYNSTDHDYGYNLSCGGNSIGKHSAKSIEKMKLAKQGKYHGAKNPKARRVYQLDKSTNEILNTFETINEAAEHVHCNPSFITLVCRGMRNTAKGFKWEYAGDEYG